MDSALEIPVSLPANGYLPVKRALDLCLALFAILLFGLPMLAIALGVRLSSPGPILYRQKRIGKNGTPFDMLKFRSMQVHNNPDLHKQYVQKLILENTQPSALGQTSLKMVRDPRITGLGKYLRKYGLDELPQFFNVLKGEMSVVGPRPSLPYEVEVYQQWHKQRLTVLPGITGPWQALAHNTISFDEMVHLDLKYIQSMNVWLDFGLILLTPITMIKGKGAD